MPNATGLTAIVTVGDEILSGHTQDTNSSLLARAAFAAGRPVSHIEVVPDQPAAIIAAIRRAIDDPAITRIAVCGGIGPTPDDRTFQAVADALGRPLELNAVAYGNIEALAVRMHAAGWIDKPEVSEANRRCAMVPVGATVLTNRRGMAPPLAIEVGNDRWLFVLPGIPREFSTIVEEELIPGYFAGGTAPVVREVRYRSVPEFGDVRTHARARGGIPRRDRRFVSAGRAARARHPPARARSRARGCRSSPAALIAQRRLGANAAGYPR